VSLRMRLFLQIEGRPLSWVVSWVRCRFGLDIGWTSERPRFSVFGYGFMIMPSYGYRL
jgi:hypothetical protein